MLWANEIFDRARPDTDRREGDSHEEARRSSPSSARGPEIIRLSRVIAALDRHCEHVLVHTGQNYDYELNQIFFDDLGLRKPDHFLEAAGAHRAPRPSAT